MLLHFPDGSQRVSSIEPALQETLQNFEGACKTRQRYESFKTNINLMYCFGPLMIRSGFHLMAFAAMGLVHAFISSYVLGMGYSSFLILTVASTLIYTDAYGKMRYRTAQKTLALCDFESAVL